MAEFDLRDHLAHYGWARVPLFADGNSRAAEVQACLDRLLGKLGRPIKQRRQTGVLRPMESEQARPRSLSARHGLGVLPFHCDTAHWPTPARFLALCRTDSAKISVPTRLFDTRQLEMDDIARQRAERAVFLIRNGRKTFYGTILSRHRAFTRVDPECMEPQDEDGERAITMFDIPTGDARIMELHLAPGEALIVDNWRMLHGRGPVPSTCESRELVRSLAL